MKCPISSQKLIKQIVLGGEKLKRRIQLDRVFHHRVQCSLWVTGCLEHVDERVFGLKVRVDNLLGFSTEDPKVLQQDSQARSSVLPNLGRVCLTTGSQCVSSLLNGVDLIL